jgi:hypothetical protein
MGVSATTYTFYSQALKAFRGQTTQGTLVKVSYDNQILEIDHVYKDRAIKFQINDSTWQYVNNPSGEVLQITGGILQESIAMWPGTKTLKMRSNVWSIGVTGIDGGWWTSENEYNIYN